MDFKEREKVIELFDFYGSLLTEKQQEYFKLYYFEDYSLAEIAVDYDISRNAIHDQLKIAITKMNEFEDKLHLVSKKNRILEAIDDSDIKEAIAQIINE